MPGELRCPGTASRRGSSQIPNFLEAVAADASRDLGRAANHRDGVRFEMFETILFVRASAGPSTPPGQDEHDMMRCGPSAAG